MTLSILHTEASLGWGGQEIRILTESAGMIARGHEVVVACPPEARIFTEAPRYGVPAVALPIGRKRPAGILALRRYLQSKRFDVINTHSSTDTWLAALARAGGDKPPVVRTRHLSAAVPNNLATRWLYRRATKHIVTTGEAIRQQLIRDNGIDPERISSIPTGIDPALYLPGDRAAARAQLGLPLDAKLVGIVATLRSWKGHRYLLEALARLLQPLAHLVIVGDGPQRQALIDQAAKLALVNRVIFAGNQKSVTPWLQALDAFALPSYANEGVPQALVQAMFTALPCVTTGAGAIGEIAEHEHTALVVPTHNADALAAALSRLLLDPALGDRLGRAGRELVARQFNLATMLDRMEAAFNCAIS